MGCRRQGSKGSGRSERRGRRPRRPGRAVGPKEGVAKSLGRTERVGRAYFGRARDPNGIGVCQAGVRAGPYLASGNLHPASPASYSARVQRRAGPAESGAGARERTPGARRGGTMRRGGAGARGWGRCLCWRSTAPRGGAAPPSPDLGEGGRSTPGRPWGTWNTWDTPEPGNGSREGVWKEGKPSRRRGGRDA